MAARRDQRGFTLLELLVASAVFGVVIVGALTMFATANRSYRISQTRAESHQNARAALELIARELRVAGYDPSDTISVLTSATPIQTGGSNGLTFVADVTDDGVLDQVTYRLQGGQLVRERATWTGSAFSTPVASEVADGIAMLAFTYFDDTTPANTAIAAPVAAAELGDIRRVNVAIVTAETMADQQQNFPLAVDVRIRN